MFQGIVLYRKHNIYKYWNLYYIMEKKCLNCNNIFIKKRRNANFCSKLCIDANYRKCNKEKIILTNNDYYKKNKETITKVKKAYNNKNKEKITQQSSEYYIKNKEKILEYKREWRNKNKLKIAKQRAEYYQKNKLTLLENSKKYNVNWRKDNQEHIVKVNAEYRKNNKEKITLSSANYNKNNLDKLSTYKRERRKNDSLFRLIGSIRSRLTIFLKSKNITKSNSTFNMIGCTPEELKLHLEKQFTDGMCWELYGSKIHTDHRIPLASATTEEEALKLCHFSNLQPMWADENLAKGSKMPEDFYSEPKSL